MTGLRIVPSEPDASMIAAGADNNPTHWDEGTDRGFIKNVANDVYVSMVAAAPALTDEQIDVMCRKMRKAFNVAPHDQDRRMMRKFILAITNGA